MQHNYFVYIIINKNKTVLYIGVTNDLENRLKQHINGDNKFAFTKRYNCYFLIYFERFQFINDAIAREKELKGWTRAKKNKLIEIDNKDWGFLNDKILEDNKC